MKLVDLTRLTRTTSSTLIYDAYVYLTMLKTARKQSAPVASFMKNYICKHIIGMSIILKYCKPPPEAKNVQIVTKRKKADHLKLKKLYWYNDHLCIFHFFSCQL